VVPAPAGLRPFLQFTRLPARALAAARTALDEDAVFRARVAVAADEATVGRAGWLFLRRPEGWDGELAQLAATSARTTGERAERRAETSAERRAEAAGKAAARAAEALTVAREELGRASAALATERQARRAASDKAASVQGRLEELLVAAEEAGAERARLVTELAVARAAVEELTRSAGRSSDADPAGGVVPSADDVGCATRARAAASRLGDVAATLAEMTGALEAVAEELRGPPPVAPHGTGEAHAPSAAGQASPTGSEEARRAGRTPLALPPGIHDDSPEAAAALLRSPAVVVLVDGYNVSQEGWPGLSPLDQRQRLLDVLAELAARTTARIEVVFDGADTALPAPPAAHPRALRVSFSPPGMEADEVLVERAASLPSSQAVLVVSSDGWVREGALRVGANVVAAVQLLAAAGRRSGRGGGGVIPPR